MKILMVDDDKLFLEASCSDIESLGYSVSTCTSGYDALNLLTDNRYDVAFIDIEMPQMDGIELCRLVRKGYPNIEVIFLTAQNMTGAELDNCCDPLITVIRKEDFLQGYTDVAEILKKAILPKVLVVDDHKLSLEDICDELAGSFMVFPCIDTSEALSKINSKRLTLVLLDVDMPDKVSIELAQIILKDNISCDLCFYSQHEYEFLCDRFAVTKIMGESVGDLVKRLIINDKFCFIPRNAICASKVMKIISDKQALCL